MKMLNEFVLVSPIKESFTKSGLIIPENVSSKFQTGIVGFDSKSLKAGSTVLYKNEAYGFDEELSCVELDGKKYVVLTEAQIVGTME